MSSVTAEELRDAMVTAANESYDRFEGKLQVHATAQNLKLDTALATQEQELKRVQQEVESALALQENSTQALLLRQNKTDQALQQTDATVRTLSDSVDLLTIMKQESKTGGQEVKEQIQEFAQRLQGYEAEQKRHLGQLDDIGQRLAHQPAPRGEPVDTTVENKGTMKIWMWVVLYLIVGAFIVGLLWLRQRNSSVK